MHKVYTCAACDEIFEKIWDVKVHSYNHSYTNTDKNTNKLELSSAKIRASLDFPRID